MKISIFGLGYVGCVSAGCLAGMGHQIIGVDKIAAKVNAINAGRVPVIEKDLDQLIAESVKSGKLRATEDANEAVQDSEGSIICVGTPSEATGDLNLTQVLSAADEIGRALANKDAYHIVIVRSTVLPGSVRRIIIPRLEATSGKRAGRDFDVVHNPEFMRESMAVADFRSPPRTVVGADDPMIAAQTAGIYSGVVGPVVMTSIEVSEMIKYADNVWHALKVAFANEMGTFCKASGVDSRAVMELFCQDVKLNIAPTYLSPGFAFGGSCLPKDLRAVTARARSLNLELPVINSIIRSNDQQLRRGVDAVRGFGKRLVSLLGLSFKAGTDDMRESPLLELLTQLLAEGFDVRVFDRHATLSDLFGANREYLLARVPNISTILAESLDSALAHGEVIIVGNADPEFLQIVSRLNDNHILLDLVGVLDPASLTDRYHGVNW